MQSLILKLYDSTKQEKIKCFDRLRMRFMAFAWERMETNMKKIGIALLLIALLMLPAAAFAGNMDAGSMEAWLSRFCDALPSVPLLGDPQMTADPARPGEYLYEYAFGTVTATSDSAIEPDDIVQIDVRTQQVTDCRGMRVGMTLEDVLDGAAVRESNTQLYVLSTQEAGLGFSWAYIGDGGVYGVEHITYGGSNSLMKEYTLTYVIDDMQNVSAIRIRCAKTTQAEAEQSVNTAEEIALRQRGEVYAVKNSQSVLDESGLQVMGIRALGMQVADLIALLGEPVEIQALTGNQGRILLYEGTAIELTLDEMTGEEIVCGVSASASDVTGPNRLMVGMSVQEAAALFACDEDVYAVGGVLYMRGEAAGDAPYAELVRSGRSGEATLRYVTPFTGGRVAALEISIQDSVVRNWHFYIAREAANGV